MKRGIDQVSKEKETVGKEAYKRILSKYDKDGNEEDLKDTIVVVTIGIGVDDWFFSSNTICQMMEGIEGIIYKTRTYNLKSGSDRTKLERKITTCYVSIDDYVGFARQLFVVRDGVTHPDIEAFMNQCRDHHSRIILTEGSNRRIFI